MRAVSALLMLSSLTLANQAHAEDHAPHWSLSLERVASVNAVFLSLEDGEDDFGLRTRGVTAGGPISNPLSAPRLGVDYLTPFGLTLGTGLAFGLGDLDSSENGRERDEGNFSLLMLNPRVGYRFSLGKVVDLTPRVGATLGWASVGSGEYESCEFSSDVNGNESSNCQTEEGDSVNASAAIVDLELLATFRLTDSFNILTGLSYDILVAASAEEGDGDGDREEFENGHFSSMQLWLGLGGYL